MEDKKDDKIMGDKKDDKKEDKVVGDKVVGDKDIKFVKLDNGEILAKEICSYEDIDDELVGHPDSIYNTIDQITRIEWLISLKMEKPIMEIGTACGYVLGKVNGDIGIDIRPDRLLVAKTKYPDKRFYYGNVLNLTPFYNMKINGIEIKSIIISEILEHISFDLAFHAIIHCLNTAPVLYYTLPNIDKDIGVSKNIEHKWYPTRDIIKILMDNVNKHKKIVYDINEVSQYLCGTIKRIEN